jgi:hypothetical protein
VFSLFFSLLTMAGEMGSGLDPLFFAQSLFKRRKYHECAVSPHTHDRGEERRGKRERERKREERSETVFHSLSSLFSSLLISLCVCLRAHSKPTSVLHRKYVRSFLSGILMIRYTAFRLDLFPFFLRFFFSHTSLALDLSSHRPRGTLRRAR